MKLPKVRELIEAIKALIVGPYTNNYPFTPVKVPEGFRGKPEYNEEECVGCKACSEVCPARAIEVVDDKKARTRTLTHHQDQCVFCQQCEKACITEKGIVLTKQFDMTTYNRHLAVTTSKKELLLCENCNSIIGCTDHIRFLAKKVGHLLYANPTLLLARHKDLKAMEKQAPVKTSHPRGGHLKILCPNCRREAILNEQW